MPNLPIHCVNPGRFWELAQSWADEFPLLDVRRAYQVDCGSQGGWPRDGDIATIDLAYHFAETKRKIGSAVPAGSPPGLVSVDVEIGTAHWKAASTGQWPHRYIEHGLAWYSYLEQLLGEGFVFGWYGWPMRLDWPWLHESMQRASEHGLGLFSRMDVLMPMFYDRLPGGVLLDRVSVELGLAESARLSELLGGKPVIPTLNIRHPNGDPLADEVFERLVNQVFSWGARMPISGLALWSDARNEDWAEGTRVLNEERYAPILCQAFGIDPESQESPDKALQGSEGSGVAGAGSESNGQA